MYVLVSAVKVTVGKNSFVGFINHIKPFILESYKNLFYSDKFTASLILSMHAIHKMKFKIK